MQHLESRLELRLDLIDRLLQRLPRRHIVTLWEDGDARHLSNRMTGERIEHRDLLYLIIEELNANRFFVGFRRKNINHIASNSIGGATKFHLIAGVLQLSQPPQNPSLVHAVAPIEMKHHVEIGLRISQAINTGHGRHHQRVTTLKQCLGR